MPSTSPDTNPAFRAVQIALVAIKQNRQKTWAGLKAAGVDPRLSEDQLRLIEDHLEYVNCIQFEVGNPVTVTCCPNCDRIAFLGSGSAPAKCTLTHGCGGKPVKAAVALEKKVGPEMGEPDGEAADG